MSDNSNRKDNQVKFQGTDTYISTRELNLAVNAAVTLQRPLLVKGEPGTGKTLLAHEISKGLNKRLITWHIKSTCHHPHAFFSVPPSAPLGALSIYQDHPLP